VARAAGCSGGPGTARRRKRPAAAAIKTLSFMMLPFNELGRLPQTATAISAVSD
jgi:hypothetical protein